LTGEYFEKKTALHMSTKKYSVLVQTDKSTYKPSDTIKYRVIVFGAGNKPYTPAKVNVFFTDGDNNRVKQLNDIKLTTGVYEDELQLSDSPVLGDNWQIHGC